MKIFEIELFKLHIESCFTFFPNGEMYRDWAKKWFEIISAICEEQGIEVGIQARDISTETKLGERSETLFKSLQEWVQTENPIFMETWMKKT